MPWPFPQIADLVRVMRGDRLFPPGDTSVPLHPGPDAMVDAFTALATWPGKMDGLATAALEVAIELIGQGEQGGDNRGPFVEMLIEPARPPQNWCAAFVGFCYQRAAARLNIPLPFQRSLGAKRLGRNVGAVGRVFTDPALARPGDLMVFHRGAKGSWMGHVAMVERLGPREMAPLSPPSPPCVHTIEGNSGPKVKRGTRFVHLDRFALFASVRP